MKPHAITRRHSKHPPGPLGGRKVDPTDPNVMVSIVVEAPEDISSPGISHASLDVIFGEVSKYKRGIPQLYEALGLERPSPDRDPYPVHPDPEPVIGQVVRVQVDPHLDRDERKEIASLMVQAAIDEAGLRGAVRLFTLSKDSNYERLFVDAGFAVSGFKSIIGNDILIKKIDQPDVAINPVPCQIKITEAENCIYVKAGPSDLFCDTKERSHIGLDFWPEFKGLRPFTQYQLKKKYPELIDKAVGNIFEFGAGFFPIGDLSSNLLGAAIHEAKGYGAPALFATAFWEEEPGLSELFKKHGMSDLGPIAEDQSHVYAIFFGRKAEANPEDILVGAMQLGDASVVLKHESDLFHEAKNDALVEVNFHSLSEVFSVKTIGEILARYPRFKMRDKFALISRVGRDALFSENVFWGLIGTAEREAVDRGCKAMILYKTGGTNDKAYPIHGFEDTGVTNLGGNRLWVKILDQKTANNPPPIQIERLENTLHGVIHYVQAEDLFYGKTGSRVYMHMNEIDDSAYMRSFDDLSRRSTTPTPWLDAMRAVFGKNIDKGDKLASVWADFTEDVELFGSVEDKRRWPIYTQLFQAAINEARESGALGVYTFEPKIIHWTRSMSRALHGMLSGIGFRKTSSKMQTTTSNDCPIYALRFESPAVQNPNKPELLISRQTNHDDTAVVFRTESDLFYEHPTGSFIQIEFGKAASFSYITNALSDFSTGEGDAIIGLINPMQVKEGLGSEIADALLDAALNEARIRGAIGVFSWSAVAHPKFWKTHGFTQTRSVTRHDHMGYSIYILKFDQTRGRMP